LEEQLLQALPLDRVLLDYRDHVLREVRPDVPQPLRQPRRRRAQARAALPLLLGLVLLDVVDHPQRLVDFHHLLGEQRAGGLPAAERLFGGLPQDQAPLLDLVHHIKSSPARSSVAFLISSASSFRSTSFCSSGPPSPFQTSARQPVTRRISAGSNVENARRRYKSAFRNSSSPSGST